MRNTYFGLNALIKSARHGGVSTDSPTLEEAAR
nr:MAG TPA: hypothetical protein [Caudoviricetes sp.]